MTNETFSFAATGTLLPSDEGGYVQCSSCDYLISVNDYLSIFTEPFCPRCNYRGWKVTKSNILISKYTLAEVEEYEDRFIMYCMDKDGSREEVVLSRGDTFVITFEVKPDLQLVESRKLKSEGLELFTALLGKLNGK